MQRQLLILCVILGFGLNVQAQSSIAVSPAAMNVFYRGLANPLDVSASGVAAANTTIRVSNTDSLTWNGKKWLVWPGKGSTCVIEIFELHQDEDSTSLGKKEFRVKNVPNPKAYFGGKTGESSIAWRELMAAGGVIAKMENFEFDLRFQINGYDIIGDTGSGEIQIHSMKAAKPAAAKSIFKAYSQGGSLEIRNIKSLGPDGTLRDLSPIILHVKPHVSYGFGKVDIENKRYLQGTITSSAQPSKAAFKQLDLIGARNVLNLRRRNPDRRFAEGTSITLYHLPIKTRKMSEEDIVTALKIIDDSHYNILIHCKHGSDRTGTVVAAYRVIHQGWTKEEAILDMRHTRFGYHEKLFPNLVVLIENLDVEGIRNELGVGN